jgi:hypothetical protein
VISDERLWQPKAENGKPCKRLGGQIEWKTSGPFDVTHAVIRDDGSITVDCDCGELGKPYVYTIQLNNSHKIPDMYKGSFTARGGSEGRVDCLKFESQTGVALLGEWTENGKIERWAATLCPEHPELLEE